jgi:hypothetical protein
MNYHRLQDIGFRITLKRDEEKTKTEKSSEGVNSFKSFAVHEPLNILSLKTRLLNPDGDNKVSNHFINKQSHIEGPSKHEK